MKKYVRYYLRGRDKKILELLIGSEHVEPMAPKQIGIVIGISQWAVYRRIDKMKKEGAFKVFERRIRI